MDRGLPYPMPTAEDRAQFKLDLHALHSPAAAEICEMVEHDWVDAGRDCSGGAICLRCARVE
jgi:hypothetical protein